MLYIIVALVLAILLLYIPSFLYGRTSLQGLTDVVGSLEDGVRHSSFFSALIVGAAVSLPIAFGIILDQIIFKRIEGTTKKIVPNEDKKTITDDDSPTSGGLESVRLFRFMPIVIFSVPYFVMAVLRIPAHYVMATLMSQRMLSIIYILFSLRCDKLGVWTEKVTRRLALINIASCVLNYYADISDPNNMNYIIPLYVMASLLGTIRSVYFGWNCWKWMAKMSSDWWNWHGNILVDVLLSFLTHLLVSYSLMLDYHTLFMIFH